MRSIGQADGSAQSKAGIEFGLIGANIISIEDAEMYGLEDVTNTGDRDENVLMSGHVQLEVNEGSKVNYSGARYNQFLDDLNVIQPDGDSLIAKVDFSNGNTNMNGKKSGSIVVGSVVDADLAPKVSAAIEDLTGLTQQGEVRGVVTFNLKDAASTPEKYQAIVMKATITCQPVPEKR